MIATCSETTSGDIPNGENAATVACEFQDCHEISRKVSANMPGFDDCKSPSPQALLNRHLKISKNILKFIFCFIY